MRIAGATVHFVDERRDHGPIILQGAVAVAPDDTEETLARASSRSSTDSIRRRFSSSPRVGCAVEGRRVRIGGEPTARERRLLPDVLPAGLTKIQLKAWDFAGINGTVTMT